MPNNSVLDLIRDECRGSTLSTTSEGEIVLQLKPENWRENLKKVHDHPQLGFRKMKLLTAVKDQDQHSVWVELESELMDDRLSVRCVIPGNKTLPSLVEIWPCADWQEQEVFENYGIAIEGTAQSK